DRDSLALIEQVLTHPDTRHLMLVGAYRDHEVGPTHLLTATADKVRKVLAPLEIHLGPLGLEALRQWVADTLRCDQQTAAALVEVLRQKTEGNPFFINQLLRALLREGLIAFDSHARAWRWDLARIRETPVTDNVAELIAQRLAHMPIATQEILQWAACLGSRFQLDDVVAVAGKTLVEVTHALQQALNEDL